MNFSFMRNDQKTLTFKKNYTRILKIYQLNPKVWSLNKLYSELRWRGILTCQIRDNSVNL